MTPIRIPSSFPSVIGAVRAAVCICKVEDEVNGISVAWDPQYKRGVPAGNSTAAVTELVFENVVSGTTQRGVADV
jgi:hypothetical protein